MKMIGHGKERWEYLLRADFGGADSGAIANGTSVETASSGSVQDGTLTVRDVGGSMNFEIISNLLVANDLGGAAALSVGYGVRGGAITKELGKVFKWGAQNDNTTPSISGMAGFIVDSDFATLNDRMYMFRFLTGAEVGVLSMDGAGSVDASISPVDSYSAGVQKEFAIMLGGYNSSGEPYAIGDAKSSFLYGAAFFTKSGSDWILRYKIKTQNTSTLYPAFWGYFSSAANIYRVGSCAIPNADLSHLLKPNNLSTSVSTTDTFTHYSDCFIEMLITTLPSSGNLDLEIRRQDDSNKWIARATSAGAVSLQEVVAASETPRITGGSISNGQRLVVIADDTTIKLFSNDAAAGSPYTSATNFSNDTGGKVVFGSGAVSHIADYPIGTNGEYNDLDRY